VIVAAITFGMLDISGNADKTLRKLQAEIREIFNVSKSLKWASKEEEVTQFISLAR
jgi:hypothetical protein